MCYSKVHSNGMEIAPLPLGDTPKKGKKKGGLSSFPSPNNGVSNMAGANQGMNQDFMKRDRSFM